VELGFLLLFDRAVGRQADVGDRLAGGSVVERGVSGGIADQDDFIDAAHPSIIATASKNPVINV
jgi:hypothetical protein